MSPFNAAGGNNPKATTAVETIEDQDLRPYRKRGRFSVLEWETFSKVFDLNFIGTFIPSMV